MNLSIITINFNHAEGLKRTIDSIVNQTFSDYEWIVVDGGSTDGSKELIEQYKEHFAWWCSEPDKGVYNAMNKGIAHATGEYINFMNSGDMFATPTILEEIFSTPQSADILYGQMVRGDYNGPLNNTPLLKPNIEWYDFYYCTFNHQATFTKRLLFSTIGLFDETYSLYGDWDFFARAIVHHHVDTLYLPIKIAIYEGGGISDTSDKQKEELQKLRDKIYGKKITESFIREYQGLSEVILPHRLSRFLYKALKYCTRKIIKILK